MKKIKAGFLGVVMMMFCMCIMVMTPNTAMAAEVLTASNATELHAAINSGGRVKLLENVDLEEDHLVVSETEVTLDLNGKTITANGCDGAIQVTGGKLTINGNGNVVATVGDGYSMAVWANGGRVIINGGTYTNDTDGSERGTDLIYASGTGKITINGGTFEAATPKWTLNLKDNSDASIVVRGGSFAGFDPSAAKTEPDSNYSFVSTGYEVSGPTDGYYTVSKVSTEITYVAQIGENKYETLQEAVDDGGEVTLLTNVDLEDEHLVITDTTVILNLNGKTIKANGCDGAIQVTDGKLTIEGNGNVEATLGDGYSMAVWASGGEVIIKGGTYQNDADESDERGTDLIYASANGMITIEGGTFKAATPKWTLNLKDNSDASIVVKGGSFKNFDPSAAETEPGDSKYSFVADGYAVVKSGDNYTVNEKAYVAQIGETKYKDLQAAVNAGGEVTLLTDVDLGDDYLVVNGGTVTLNLNGKTITANGCDGTIQVTGGNLTIKGDGEVVATVCEDHGYSMAVWANGGNVVIEGGTYQNGTDGSERGTDLIYASGTGKITINGGTFKAATPKWTLNLKDNSDASIVVRGGSFEKFDPSAAETEPGDGTYSFVADGCVIVASGDKFVVVGESDFTVSIEDGSPVINVYAGEEITLKATTYPTGQAVVWSSDSDLITIDKTTGKVYAGASIPVSAIITAEIEGKGTPDTIEVAVKLQTLDTTELDLAKGDSSTINVVGTATTAKWESSNTAVATVEQNGKVTAVGSGTATIKVLVNGLVALECKVNVPEVENDIAIFDSSVTVGDGLNDANIANKADEAAADTTVKSGVEDAVKDAVSNENIDNLLADLKLQDDVVLPEDATAEDIITVVIDAIVEQVKEVINKVIADVTANTEVQKPAEGLTTALSNAGSKLGLTGDKSLEVKLNPQLEDQKVSVKTYVDDEGKLQTETTVEQLTFKVKPELTVVDNENPNNSETKTFDNGLLNDYARITFRLPIPESVNVKFAKVVHRADNGTIVDTKYYEIKGTGAAKYIEVTVGQFSEFDVTFVESKPYTGGSSSGTKSVKKKPATGTWVQNEIGWWYRNADGTWPAAQWVELEWNGVKTWYYFNAEGYMHSGWLVDGGHRYFLHNVADGTQGYMYTGWHQIDGKWYYFNPVSGGPKGSLLVNTVTPDGYTVDANGVWVQ